MEILTGIWANIESVTIGGVSILLLTNSLTQAVKKYLPLEHFVIPFIVGIVLCLIAGVLGWMQVLAGIVVGYLAGGLYDAFNSK